MAEIHDKVRELLETPILHRGLAEAFYTGFDSPSSFQEIDLADHLKRAQGERLFSTSEDPFGPRINMSVEGLPKKLIDVFQEIVVDNLPNPAAITPEELASIAISQLTGLPLHDTKNDEVVRAYRRFVTFALSDMDDERLGTTYFAFGRWLCEDDDEYEAVFPGSGGEVLWSSPSGFSLSAFATGRDLSEVCAYMVGQLSAHCSELARKKI